MIKEVASDGNALSRRALFLAAREIDAQTVLWGDTCEVAAIAAWLLDAAGASEDAIALWLGVAGKKVRIWHHDLEASLAKGDALAAIARNRLRALAEIMGTVDARPALPPGHSAEVLLFPVRGARAGNR